MRVAVLVLTGLDQEPGLAEPADDLVGGLGRRQAVQPPVIVVEAPGLVDRREHRQVVHARQLEVLGAAARCDVDDAGALVDRDLVPGDHAVLDVPTGSQVVERAAVAPPDELGTRLPLDERVRRE